MDNNPANWKISKMADFGSSEPWVARVWLSFKEFQEQLHLGKDEKIKVNKAIDEMVTSLSMTFISLRAIEKSINDPNTPILSIQRDYTDFYNKLWSVLIDRFRALAKALGFEIGFIFGKQNKFIEELNKFSDKWKFGDGFKDTVIEDKKRWINRLQDFRNNLQHASISKEDEKHFYNYEHSKIYFDNVWVFIEETIIILMSRRLWNIFMFKAIPEDKRDPSMPKKFEIVVNPKHIKY